MKDRIEALRNEMRKEGLSAWLTPSGDPHLSEYVADHWKARAWLSGFTGSAGTLLVTETESLLWTDGRYFVQAEAELAGSGIQLMKMATPGVPSLSEWLVTHLPKGTVLGLDARLYAVSTWKEFDKKLSAVGVTLCGKHDLPARIWMDRPKIPATPVFVHEVSYAGKTASEKLSDIRLAMAKDRVDQYLVSALDGIAWLLNIRGGDVAHNPVTISTLRVGKTDATLYIEEQKLDATVFRHLEDNGITVRPYESVTEEIAALPVGCRMAYDAKLTNAALIQQLPGSCEAVEVDDYVVKDKAIKNLVEQQNLRNCQARDGTAMVRFLMWLEHQMENDNGIAITEMDVARALKSFREALPLNRGESFDTIAAYGANAAMMHYQATESQHAVLERKGLLLVDSGGQYLDGTTDITRTVAVGPVSEEEKRACTLTLQSHIGLARAVFLEGSTGSNLDILARLPMWREGLDYKCGTGHGVGFFLSVHEGPQGFRQTPSNVKLVPGMVVTNEPGVYRAGAYGVRTENTVLVVPYRETVDGTFYCLETISCCPIDTSTLDLSMLSEDEKEWLNTYHAFVWEQVSPHLNTEERSWLIEATAPV